MCYRPRSVIGAQIYYYYYFFDSAYCVEQSVGSNGPCSIRTDDRLCSIVFKKKNDFSISYENTKVNKFVGNSILIFDIIIKF